MCEVEIAHIPGICLRRVSIHALPKKCQLESEAMSVRRCDVAGVIPPLSLIIGVIEVITWKFVAITRQRNAVLLLGCALFRENAGGLRHEQEHHQQAPYRANPHAQPRSGSDESQHSPDTARQELSRHKPASARRAESRPASEIELSSQMTAC